MKTVLPADLRLADFVRPGDRVMVAHSTAEPVTLLEQLVGQRAGYSGARVFMHVSFSGTVKAEHADALVIEGLGAVGTQRHLCKAGALDIIPSHLSDLAHLFESGELKIDVALVQVSPPDEHGRYSLGLVNDYQMEALRHARTVIAEQNDQVPFTYAEPFLTARDIHVIVPTSRPLIEVPSAPAGELENRIAAHAAPYIGDGAILQLGVGSIPEAITASLVDRRHRGFHTGVICDSYMAEDRLFKRPFPSPRYPALGSVGRNTALVALESAFGCRLRSAGDLPGADGPAKIRLPMVPSTGYPLPSGRVRRPPHPSDAADRSGPGRRVA